MAGTKQKEAVDPRVIRALGHPLRLRMLSSLNERVASPSELARDLGEPLGKVSYHAKVLLECDSIELVKTEQVRGAVEHFYRATRRAELDDAAWALVPLSVRREIAGQTLRTIWDHLAAASAEGGLDDERLHVSWTALDLDEQGYADVVALLAETLEGVMAVQAEVANRRAKDPDGPEPAHRTEVAMIHFHRAAEPKRSEGEGDAQR